MDIHTTPHIYKWNFLLMMSLKSNTPMSNKLVWATMATKTRMQTMKQNKRVWIKEKEDKNQQGIQVQMKNWTALRKNIRVVNQKVWSYIKYLAGRQRRMHYCPDQMLLNVWQFRYISRVTDDVGLASSYNRSDHVCKPPGDQQICLYMV